MSEDTIEIKINLVPSKALAKELTEEIETMAKEKLSEAVERSRIHANTIDS